MFFKYSGGIYFSTTLIVHISILVDNFLKTNKLLFMGVYISNDYGGEGGQNWKGHSCDHKVFRDFHHGKVDRQRKHLYICYPSHGGGVLGAVVWQNRVMLEVSKRKCPVFELQFISWIYVTKANQNAFQE